MLKKIFIAFFIIIPVVLTAQDKKVLFLGNSYTFYNDLPDLFKSLASAGGFEVLVDENTPGGYTLSNPAYGHLYNQQSLAKMHAEDWDYVVLQEQSQYPVIPYWKDNYFYPGAKSLDSVIKENNNCTKTLFFMTWGRKYGGQQCNGGYCSVDFVDFNHMTDSLASSYVGNADELDAPVSPVGIAWKNAIAEDDQIELFNSDGSHPSMEGSYLAACTFYASIFQESPVGLEFYSTLDENTAAFLQQIAYNTVFNNLDLWNIDTTMVNASFEYDVIDQTVNFNNYSVNADAYEWHFGDGTTDTVKNPVHHYADPGLYSVNLIAYKTCDTSSTSQFINIIVQATEDHFITEKSISIYPNPAINTINIQNHLLEGVYDVKLVDNYGNIFVHDQKVFQPESDLTLNLKDLNPGIYVLSVTKGTFHVSEKVYLNGKAGL